MALTPLNSFTTKAANFADRPNASMSAAEVKAQFDAAPEELRVFVNNLITQLNTDFALKSEIASALLGQILDGSLTDIKLSNTSGQIKERLSSFIATKGQPNGIASLGSDGKVLVTQLLLKTSLSVKTGTISDGGTIPQTAGYINYIYLVSPNTVGYGDSTSGTFGTSSRIYCSVNQSTRVVTCYTQHSDNYTATILGTANYIEIAW